MLLTVADPRPRLPAGGDLLPGAGLDDRRRHHLQGADGPVRRPRSTRRSRVVRHRPGPAGSPTRTSRCSPSPLVDVWKGVGLATLIYIAGIVAIPQEYFEAAAGRRRRAPGRSSGTSPCRWCGRRPPRSIILSLIGGLRSFDLIWAMTKGGPGFTSDVIASVIYKQYQAGFFGLSTAGNVILFIVVTAIIVPALAGGSTGEEDRADETRDALPSRRWIVGIVAILVVDRRLPRPVRVHLPHRGEDHARRPSLLEFTLADRVAALSTTSSTVLADARLHAASAPSSTAPSSRSSASPSWSCSRRWSATCCSAAQSRWNPLVNFLVLAGLIVPPAVVPTIWVLQGLGLFKTLPGLILDRGRLRALVLHPAVPRLRRHDPARARRGRDHRRRRARPAVLPGDLPAAASR